MNYPKDFTYRPSLKVKDCDTVFAPGFPAGVLVMQDITYTAFSEKDLEKIVGSLIHARFEFIERNVGVIVETIKED